MSFFRFACFFLLLVFLERHVCKRMSTARLSAWCSRRCARRARKLQRPTCNSRVKVCGGAFGKRVNSISKVSVDLMVVPQQKNHCEKRFHKSVPHSICVRDLHLWPVL